MDETDKAPFGVVIPAFGHPKFLAEAIVSACEQSIDRPIKVVVVDDGCRFHETGETVSQLIPRYQGNLFYVRQKNTRLPGARNAGIRFLLSLIPEIEAIYLLDADNRLSPNSLQVFWNALGSDPKTGWAYPDISFFGLTRGQDGFDTRETAPVYSPLKHLIGNISEAGSMVRADVFRAGVMFDETMTSGFEDWEFWLSALDAGYLGVRAVDTGFMYRGRPESMLADSKRLADGLVEKIRIKHKALFDPKNIMKLEHEEAPTFAVYIPEDGRFLLMSDPLAAPEIVSATDFNARFQAWAHNATEYFFPTKIMISPKKTWDYLRAQRHFLRWWFWQLRETDKALLSIQLEHQDLLGFSVITQGLDEQVADMFVVSSDLLLREANGASNEGDPNSQGHGIMSLPSSSITLNEDDRRTAGQLRAVFEEIKSELLSLPEYAAHTSKTFAGPHSRSVREILIRDICSVKDREPFPASTSEKRTLIAFKAELLSCSVAVDSLTKLLEKLAGAENEITVLLEHEGKLKNTNLIGAEYDWQRYVDTIVPFKLPGTELEHSMYLGKPYKRELTALAPDDIAIIARTADTVIACGTSAIIEGLGEARLHGAAGHVYLAPEFLLPEQNVDLGLAKMLAFEHAITTVAIDDLGFGAQLSAEGFPLSKFVPTDRFLQSL